MEAIMDTGQWQEGGTITVTGRGIEQDAHAAMSVDIVRGLVEAITNADDKYYLEKARSGRIMLEVERSHGPWTVSVRDRAGGMSKQELIDRIAHAGSRTSGFESGAAVRGNRGRGAKDLIAFGPVHFESIKNGHYCGLKIEPNGKWAVTEKPLPATYELRERLGIPRQGGGTVVTIQVRQSVRCPRLHNMREKLQTHYQLRDIMRDPARELILVNGNKPSEKYSLQYGINESELEEVVNADLKIDDYEDATALLRLWRLPGEVHERPASDANRPQGVLVQGERAIYENTLFAFEGNAYAHRFTGRLESPYIDSLIRDFDDLRDADQDPPASNPQPIVSRTRDGLVRDHPFYQALRAAAEAELDKVVQEEERKEREEGASVENEATRRALSRAARMAARYLQQSLQEMDDDEPLPPGDEVAFEIRPAGATIAEGEEKTLSIVAPRALFEEGREVSPSFDPEGVVDVVGAVTPLGPHRDRNDLLSTTIRLRGVLSGEATILTVMAGSSTTLAMIEVVPREEEPVPQPPEQLEFERTRYRVRWQKRKRLTLQAPLGSGLEGEEVRVTSDDDGVAVLGGRATLRLDEDLQFLVGHVTVEGRKLNARATLRAAADGSASECRVEVSTQREDDVDLEIRLQDGQLGSFRSVLKEEEDAEGQPRLFLDVMTKHPTLSRYIGDPPDYAGQDTPTWRVLLAEIIAETIVRRVLERKYPPESQGTDAQAFFVELFQRSTELAPRIHRELVSLPDVEQQRQDLAG